MVSWSTRQRPWHFWRIHLKRHETHKDASVWRSWFGDAWFRRPILADGRGIVPMGSVFISRPFLYFFPPKKKEDGAFLRCSSFPSDSPDRIKTSPIRWSRRFFTHTRTQDASNQIRQGETLSIDTWPRSPNHWIAESKWPSNQMDLQLPLLNGWTLQTEIKFDDWIWSKLQLSVRSIDIRRDSFPSLNELKLGRYQVSWTSLSFVRCRENFF